MRDSETLRPYSLPQNTHLDITVLVKDESNSCSAVRELQERQFGEF